MKVVTTLWALAFVGAAVSVDGGSIGATELITTARLSAISMPFLLALTGSLSVPRRWGYWLFVGAIAIICAYAAVATALRGSDSSGVFYSLSWVASLVVFVSTTMVRRRLNPEALVRIWFLIGALSGIAGLLVVLVQIGSGMPPSRLRLVANALLPGGLSTFLFGMFCLAGPTVAIAANSERPLDATRGWAVVGTLSLLLLGIVLASRQFLGGISLLLGVHLLWSVRGRLRLARLFFALVAVALAIGAVSVAVERLELTDFVSNRLVHRTERQMVEGSSRFAGYRLQARIIKDNPVLGVGPGNFDRLWGHKADSGILGLAAEVGAPAAIVLVAALLSYWVAAWRQRPKDNDRQRRALFKIAFPLSVIGFFWFGAFNDVANKAALWMILAFLEVSRNTVAQRLYHRNM